MHGVSAWLGPQPPPHALTPVWAPNQAGSAGVDKEPRPALAAWSLYWFLCEAPRGLRVAGSWGARGAVGGADSGNWTCSVLTTGVSRVRACEGSRVSTEP